MFSKRRRKYMSKKKHRLLISALVAGMMATSVPAAPVSADTTAENLAETVNGEEANAVQDVELTRPYKDIENGNPLITHRYSADPCAMVYDGRVYIYNTDDHELYNNAGELITNEYGRINKISVMSSADMVNWTDHGKITVGGADGVLSWEGISWAPTPAHKTINGKEKFFLYCVVDGMNVGVMTSDSPVGPWSDPLGKPLIDASTPGTENAGIRFDPAVMVDDDGTGYLCFGGNMEGSDKATAFVIQLGDDMISTVGEAKQIDAPDFFESSGIHKHNGKYYYTYSSNWEQGANIPGVSPGVCEIGYMMSDDPMGPYTYIDRVLVQPGTVFGLYGNNHQSLFDFKGKSYITYHSLILESDKYNTTSVKGYRATGINEVHYNEDGTMQLVDMNRKGVDQVEYLDPYVRNEAESMANNGGISTEDSQAPGTEVGETGIVGPNLDVCDIQNGDWIYVKGVDFGDTGAGTFTANVASDSLGGSIEIRLDDPENGTVAGTLNVSNTGGAQTWIQRSTGVSNVTGVHDVYFVFKGEADENLFNFDSWYFSEKTQDKQLVALDASLNKTVIDTVDGNNQAEVKVSAVYSDGTMEDVSTEAEITTESSSIQIEGNTVTGVEYGDAVIHIAYEDFTQDLYLKVEDASSKLKVKELHVDENTISLYTGAVKEITVTAEYYDGHTEDVTAKASYTSSDENVVTADAGVITALGGGSAVVTVAYQGEMGEEATVDLNVEVSSLGEPLLYEIVSCNPEYLPGDPSRPDVVPRPAWEGSNVVGYLENGTVKFTVNVEEEGTYRVYADVVAYGGDVRQKYSINGGEFVICTYENDTIQLDGIQVSQWGGGIRASDLEVELNAGENTIEIGQAGSNMEIRHVILQKLNSAPEVTLDAITVTPPAKTEYQVGEEFDPSGLVVTGQYSNGNEIVLGSDKYEIDSSSFNKEEPGEYEIRITSTENPELSESFLVTVKPNQEEEEFKNTVTEVTAAVRDDNSVLLTWEPVNRAQSYGVYRKAEGAQEFEQIAVTTRDVVSFVDRTAEAGQTYYYTVKGFWEEDGQGISTQGPEDVKVTIPDNEEDLQGIFQQVMPEVTAEVNEAGEVTVTWNAIENAGSYRIYRKEAGGAFKGLANAEADAASYVDTTAEAGKTYYYTVKGFWDMDAQGVCTQYPTNVSVTIPVDELATPAVKTRSVNYCTVEVTWNRIAGADKYVVYRKEAKPGTAFKSIGTVSGNTLKYRDGNAEMGVNYYYTVKAFSGSIYSDYQKTITGMAVPSSPGLSAASSSKGVTITWTGSKAGANKFADGYRVFRKTVGGSWKTVGTVGANTRSFTDTTGAKGTTYVYTVRAYVKQSNGTNLWGTYNTTGVTGVKK